MLVFINYWIEICTVKHWKLKLKTLGVATPTQSSSFPTTKKNLYFPSCTKSLLCSKSNDSLFLQLFCFILCTSPTPVCTSYLPHTCAWASFVIQDFWYNSPCGLSDSNKLEWNKIEVWHGMVGMASSDKGRKFWMEIYTRN